MDMFAGYVSPSTMAAAGRLISFEFEVFGKVQGVFFRKYTQETAQSYGLVGWVKNTDQGTVTGMAQGPADKMRLMKDWLRYKGSPYSTIQKLAISNEETVPHCQYKKFSIKGGW